MRVLVTGGSGFIGTNLIVRLTAQGHVVANVDVSSPKLREHTASWIECDILNKQALLYSFEQFKPTHVVHLAARTDVEGNSLVDYEVNTSGTSNLIEVVMKTTSVERLIVTSTQFVHQSVKLPSSDEEFVPYTVYGESKVVSEKLTRGANLGCIWSIIRPTNIWGPWHTRYPSEFWRTLSQGRYLHPGRQKVVRSYGYVGNVVWQIIKILDAPAATVNRKVFYVGDKPIDLYEWVNGFSIQQIGKTVTVVPRLAVRVAALLGDLLKTLGLRFPITSSRYRSMTTDNPAPMDLIFVTFGEPPYSVADGIRETVEWMRRYHPELVKS